MGSAYLGLALTLFGGCYAQYHDRMGFYYQRFSIPGLLMFIFGIIWCAWIYLVR